MESSQLSEEPRTEYDSISSGGPFSPFTSPPPASAAAGASSPHSSTSKMPVASHSSLSSVESTELLAVSSTMKSGTRRSTMENLGRAMFLLSVGFFIAGVLITVFGFVQMGLSPSQQLPLQITGPAFLVSTLVIWVLGCVFSRLWKMEWRRQQQAMELRTRVQLHALAMDMLKKPTVVSPRVLQDPRLRRQLLMKLRQQNAFEISSEANSRRSSRAASLQSKRRKSSIMSSLLRQGAENRRASDCPSSGGKVRLPPYELPGIQISRIETMDFDDGSVFSGGGRRGGSKRFIVVHSDASSDFSRLSFPSEYSLSGSRSSRSRSSRDSSNVSSRLWDFSPRESDWDVNAPIGSISKQDLHGGGGGGAGQGGGGGGQGGGRDYFLLSPSIPRKGSVVTFDMSEQPRRHSSPAPSLRRKDSAGECSCTASGSTTTNNNNSSRGGGQEATVTTASAMRSSSREGSTRHLLHRDELGESRRSLQRKRSSCEQSLRSLTIDEDDAERMSPSSTGERKSVSDLEQRQRPPMLGQGHGPSSSGIRRTSLYDDSDFERRSSRSAKNRHHGYNNNSGSDVAMATYAARREREEEEAESTPPEVRQSRAEAETQTMNEAVGKMEGTYSGGGGGVGCGMGGGGSGIGGGGGANLLSGQAADHSKPLETVNVLSVSDNEDNDDEQHHQQQQQQQQHRHYHHHHHHHQDEKVEMLRKETEEEEDGEEDGEDGEEDGAQEAKPMTNSSSSKRLKLASMSSSLFSSRTKNQLSQTFGRQRKDLIAKTSSSSSSTEPTVSKPRSILLFLGLGD